MGLLRKDPSGLNHALAAAYGFCVASLHAIPDPTYLAFNDLFFRASALFERILPEGWGVHVVGEWEKE